MSTQNATSAPSVPPSSRNFRLEAAQRMVAQGRSLDELPPPLQQAWLQDKKQRDTHGFDRLKQAHADQAQAEGPDGVTDTVTFGLAATAQAGVDACKQALALDKIEEAEETERALHEKNIERFEMKLAAQNPQRYAHYKKQNADAEHKIAADADPETWRRRDAERSEQARSQALLARDADAWEADLARKDPERAARVRQQRDHATARIVDDGAPDALERGRMREQIATDEQRLLARDKAAWLATLSPAQRAVFEHHQMEADASITQSGLDAAEHRTVVEDTLTFGASSSLKGQGVGAAALDLATLGSYSQLRRGGESLGRGQAWREQADQLRQIGSVTDAARGEAVGTRMQAGGAFEAGLGAANLFLLKGTGVSATTQGLERVGVVGAAETEGKAVLGAAAPQEARSAAGAALGRESEAALQQGVAHEAERLAPSMQPWDPALADTERGKPMFAGLMFEVRRRAMEFEKMQKFPPRTRVEGGRVWTDFYGYDPQTGEFAFWKKSDDTLIRQVNVPSCDGGPPFLREREMRLDPKSGSTVIAREEVYRDFGGTRWIYDGSKVYTQRAHSSYLKQEARQKGAASIQVLTEGGQMKTVNVYGGATEAQLRFLKSAFGDLPEPHRALVDNVYLSEDMGGKSFYHNGLYYETSKIDGLSTMDNEILLEPKILNWRDRGRQTLHHEVGHALDGLSRASSLRPGFWGRGKSVSRYGETDAFEDFAETYAAVVGAKGNPVRLRWPKGVEKKAELARLIGVHMPTNAEVAAYVAKQALMAAGAGWAAIELYQGAHDSP